MNNQNPFVPQGALLELQGKRRSRMKLAVFCVLAVCVTGLMAMLIQGCKRETEANAPENTPATADTNLPPIENTNPAPTEVSNPPVTVPPVSMTPPPMATPPAAPAGSEYTIVKGDTLAKIAKAHGVSVKALEAANPNAQPTKLKIGQKIVIPAPTSSAAPAAAPGMALSGGEQLYTVKSGDNLSKISKEFGTSVKALQAANNLATTSIKVGQKLKIPAKAETAAPAPAARSGGNARRRLCRPLRLRLRPRASKIIAAAAVAAGIDSLNESRRHNVGVLRRRPAGAGAGDALQLQHDAGRRALPDDAGRLVRVRLCALRDGGGN